MMFWKPIRGSHAGDYNTVLDTMRGVARARGFFLLNFLVKHLQQGINKNPKSPTIVLEKILSLGTQYYNKQYQQSNKHKAM